LRRRLFPQGDDLTAEKLGLSEEEFADLKGGYRQIPGYRWIDKRLLGDLYKKNPLIGIYEYTAGRKALQIVDTVNQAVKSAMLFLRPAYIFPNMMGNIALNLIQQGMMSPFHMGENLRLWLKSTKGTKELIKSQIGEGAEQARYSGPVGIAEGVQRASSAVANWFNKFVDQPFRINAWIHEARRSGYTTPAELNKLLHDPALETERVSIGNQAADEIINFERMGPGEEAFLRRLILFYPFTRGASRYSINFYKEHPFAAGIEGQLGQQGTRRAEEILGPLPAYLEGLIPLEGLGIPFTGPGEVANPASFSIQGEPAHLGRQILNFATAHPNPDLAVSQNLTTVDQAILSAFTGGTSSPFGRPGAPLAETAFGEAFGAIPLTTLYNQLRGRAATGGPTELSVFPDTDMWHALNKFFFMGALSPRIFNSDLANYRRYQEVPATYPG